MPQCIDLLPYGRLWYRLRWSARPRLATTSIESISGCPRTCQLSRRRAEHPV